MSRKVLLALLLFWAGNAALAAFQVTDDRGVTQTFDAPPRRIVSLLPSLTESVCELGGCDKLVGVDRYSNFPDAVRALAQVGGGVSPNLEAIVALRPDVVLSAKSSRALDRLEALGIKVVALEPRTLGDVRRVLSTVATLLQSGAAEAVWRRIDAGVDAAAQALPPASGRLRVYFEVSPGPYAAGTSSFIGEVLQRLGVQNIVGPELGPFPRLNPEYVVRANPGLILVSQRNAVGLSQRPEWQRLRALQNGRVCIFDERQTDILVRPGPRIAEAARLLADCIGSKGRL